MSIGSSITSRKLGAFELLIGLGLFEAIFGTGPRVAVLVGLALGFYYAKKHFGGEFSLAQLHGLTTEKKQEKPGNG